MIVEAGAIDLILRAVLLSGTALIWVVLTVRVIGLRAFSKMTAFDFVVTVATGSLLAGASQASDWQTFFQPTLAISALLGFQLLIARFRQDAPTLGEKILNSPVLLMKDGRIINEALQATRVSEDDLFAKLREANVLDTESVRAVVLESTGDVSVLHGDQLQSTVLKGTGRAT